VLHEAGLSQLTLVTSTDTQVWIPSSDCFVLTFLTQSGLSKAWASRILKEE
jgi:hypothetical protein